MNDYEITLNKKNVHKVSLNIPNAVRAINVEDAYVGTDGYLYLEFSDGSTHNAGYVKGAQGTSFVGSRQEGDTLVVIMSDGTEIRIGSMRGPAGDPVQMRVNGGKMQWKHTEDTAWTDLIGMSELVGPAGENATIAVGSVQGTPYGTQPTVTNAGTASAAVLNFTIPAGATGPQGSPGNFEMEGDPATVRVLTEEDLDTMLLADDYDADGTVAAAGGIVAYVDEHASHSDLLPIYLEVEESQIISEDPYEIRLTDAQMDTIKSNKNKDLLIQNLFADPNFAATLNLVNTSVTHYLYRANQTLLPWMTLYFDLNLAEGEHYGILGQHDTLNVVTYESQSALISDEDREQARENIGLNISSATPDMTQEVGLDSSGKLVTTAGGSGTISISVQNEQIISEELDASFDIALTESQMDDVVSNLNADLEILISGYESFGPFVILRSTSNSLFADSDKRYELAGSEMKGVMFIVKLHDDTEDSLYGHITADTTSGNGMVSFTQLQSLSEEQKLIAQYNIGVYQETAYVNVESSQLVYVGDQLVGANLTEDQLHQMYSESPFCIFRTPDGVEHGGQIIPRILHQTESTTGASDPSDRYISFVGDGVDPQGAYYVFKVKVWTGGDNLGFAEFYTLTFTNAGTVNPYSVADVVFVDFNGEIVTAYSEAEFLLLDAMPANPSHAGMTAAGWNWTLADAQSFVTANHKLLIIQMYS